MYSLYYNGKILTMAYDNESKELESTHEAVLVKDDKIYGVGKKEELFAIAGEKVILHDLKGSCLMPGFIDAHSHFVMNAQMSVCARLGDCESYDDIVDELKKYASDRNIQKGQVIFGFGYDHNFLKEGGQPDRRVLDRVSTEIPIFILHTSAHLACVNSAALQLAGITEETQNPQGGVIGRIDNTNEPSGYLEEAALQLVQKSIMPLVSINPFEMMQEAQKVYIENGVTTAQDGATSHKDLEMLKFMADAGMLKIDIVAYPLMTTGGIELRHENEKLCGAYKNHIKLGGYKLILDGSPQGRSAWMSEPYLRGEEGYCGYPWMSDEEVEKYIKAAVDENQQILVHCNGDAASEQFLNIYEKVLEEISEVPELRPVMIHCQTVRNDQLERMAKLNMIASIFVGHVWYWGDIHMKNFGEKRGNHISPVKDALSRGVHVNFHQDTPVTKPDMLHSVWCAVNRISRQGKIVGEEQKISVYQALKAVTIEAAYQYFEEKTKGTIEVGKKADLVILDKSPLDVSADDIRKIKVLQTIKNGEVLYKAVTDKHKE